MAVLGFEPWTSCSGVQCSTTEPPWLPWDGFSGQLIHIFEIIFFLLCCCYIRPSIRCGDCTWPILTILTRHYPFYHLTYRKRHRVKINDNSWLTKLRAKERALVTSHVNIYVRRK